MELLQPTIDALSKLVFQVALPTLATLAFHRLWRWLGVKSNSDDLRSVIEIMDWVVKTKVQELEQTRAAALRDVTGRIPEVEGAKLKEAALAAIRAWYGPENWETTAKRMRMTTDRLLAIVAAKVEQAVLQLKREYAAGKTSALPAFGGMTGPEKNAAQMAAK